MKKLKEGVKIISFKKTKTLFNNANKYFQKIEQNPEGIRGEYARTLYAGRKTEPAMLKGLKKAVRIISVNRGGIPTVQTEHGIMEITGTDELQFIP